VRTIDITGTTVSNVVTYYGYITLTNLPTDGSVKPDMTATVSVVWAFDGFGPPLDSSGGLNGANAGSTIPVKFSLGGNQGLAIFKAGYPASASYDCGSTPPTEASDPAGSSDSLNYAKGVDQYTFAWKTDKAWAGTCRVLILVLRDGTVHAVAVQFSKATELPVKKGSEAPAATKQGGCTLDRRTVRRSASTVLIESVPNVSEGWRPRSSAGWPRRSRRVPACTCSTTRATRATTDRCSRWPASTAR
jgi:hypothetical protein